MAFISNAMNNFTHHHSHGTRGLNELYYNPESYSQQQYQPIPQQQPYQQPSPINNTLQLPQPWSAEWHSPSQRWFYVNRSTGERTWNYPSPSFSQQPQPQPQQPYYNNSSARGLPQQQAVYNTVERQSRKPDHRKRNMALGVGAGVLGGALLAHEGHKIEDRWDGLGRDLSGGSDYSNTTTEYTNNTVEEIQQSPIQSGGYGQNDYYNNNDNMSGYGGGYDNGYNNSGYNNGYDDGYYDGNDNSGYGYDDGEDYYSSDSGY